MTAKHTAPLALLLLSALFPAAVFADEIQARFKDTGYPIELQLPSPHKDGAVLLETSFSEAPSALYDTVLIQGSMPEPGITVDLVVKARTFFGGPARYRYESFRRFPDGRFWARYRVPASRQPLKFSVVASGARLPSSLSIYESELLTAGETREETAAVAVSTVPYVPDQALFYPAGGPFPLIRRAEWQAAPPKEPYTPHQPRYFTLHHTQGNYPATREAAFREIQFIQDYHQNAKGWIDIGYHFLIDPLGNIYEGRPIKVQGAHVLSHNESNIGISIMGNYHAPANNSFTDASRDSFVAVGRYLKDTYEVQVSSFYAHREIGNTDCPGDDLYARKGELRDLIFTPAVQPQSLPGDDAGAPALTPAQERSLRQLRQLLNAR